MKHGAKTRSNVFVKVMFGALADLNPPLISGSDEQSVLR